LHAKGAERHHLSSQLFFDDPMPIPLDVHSSLFCPLACALYIQFNDLPIQYVSIMTYAEFVDDVIAESVPIKQ